MCKGASQREGGESEAAYLFELPGQVGSKALRNPSTCAAAGHRDGVGLMRGDGHESRDELCGGSLRVDRRTAQRGIIDIPTRGEAACWRNAGGNEVGSEKRRAADRSEITESLGLAPKEGGPQLGGNQ